MKTMFLAIFFFLGELAAMSRGIILPTESHTSTNEEPHWEKVTAGVCATPISEKECPTASVHFGYPSSINRTLNSTRIPPGCYYDRIKDRLYFNHGSGGTCQWKENDPVENRTTCLCKATTTDVAIHGDPHVLNLAGDAFDLLKSGTHEAVHIPRASQGSDVQLSVQVRVTMNGAESCKFFTREVVVSGRLMGSVEMLRFDSDVPFHVHLDSRTHAHASGLSWTFMREPVAFPGWSQQAGVVTEMRARTEVSGRPMYQVTMGSLILQVERASVRQHSFLNVLVKGLAQLKVPIGGILGFDEHDHASATTNKACRKAVLHELTPDLSSSGLVAEM